MKMDVVKRENKDDETKAKTTDLNDDMMSVMLTYA